MKKLMSLLLAGVAVVALSGCWNTDNKIKEVTLDELANGYKVTFTGENSHEYRIEFCGNPNTHYNLYLDGTFTCRDDYYITTHANSSEGELLIPCSAEGFSYEIYTPNSKLKVGDTYFVESTPNNNFTVRTIVTIDCPFL